METQQPIQTQDNPLSAKKNPLQNYSDPKKMGTTALITAIVSFFIFGSGLSMMAIMLGFFGIYVAVKKKAGTKIIFLNILAVILGFASKILLEIYVK